MKLHFRLWMIYSLISLVGIVTLYLLIVNIYSERAMDNQRQVAYSEGYAISGRIAGMIPVGMERAEGYLDYYSERFDTRLLLLSYDKQMIYDSFSHLSSDQRLSLTILEHEAAVPSSLFIRTDAFGLVQYTLIPVDNRQNSGYLLMVTDVNFLDSDMNKFRNQVLAYLGPATIGSFLIFYLFAAWFTRPIRRIIWHLKRVTPQRREFPMQVKEKQEIGQLVNEIKQMIHQLNIYEHRQRQFISTSSHELKTPLATMQLIVENLPSLRADEVMHGEFMQDLQVQIDKMRNTVQGMLEVYRQTDKPLHKKDVSFTQIKEHILTHFQHMAESKKLQLKFSHDVSAIAVDEDLFFRGLDNVLSNAIRYSHIEHSTIHISLTRVSSSFVTFSVCDQGRGIAKEDIPYVFEPFYRSHDAMQMHEDGSGLGLAIVKQMVDLHGGEVEVLSEFDEGTCVILKLNS